MDPRLANFLKSRRRVENGKFTHTSMLEGAKGSYYIEDDDLDEFYNIYNTVNAEGGIMGLTEATPENVPLIVDIDLKARLTNTRDVANHLYSKKTIRDIIEVYNEVIAEVVKNPSRKMMYCCVFEKSKPTVDGETIKDGIHLHYPHLYLPKRIQSDVVRTRVIDKLRKNGTLNDLRLINKLEDVFDKRVPHNVWLMYGSRKSPDKEPYMLTKIVDFEGWVKGVKEVFKTPFAEGSIEWNLPRYLSVRKNEDPPELTIEDLPMPKSKRSVGRQEMRNYYDIVEDLKTAETLMCMLADSRADDYGQWMEVGWTLFSISDGHSKGLDLWREFSSRSVKYKDGECEQLWEKMNVHSYSIASLKYYAHEDSPDEYTEFVNSKIDAMLYAGISQDEHDIAEIVFLMYEGRFVCADGDRIWYEFKNHRWHKSHKGITLRMHFSKELVNRYNAFIKERLEESMRPETDPTTKQNINSQIMIVNKLISKLKKTSYKNAVLTECIEFFYDPTFLDRIDIRPELLVFENGVYDAKLYQFRKGRPTDYCTKSTRIHYHAKIKKTDPRLVKLENMLDKIFVNKHLYKFFEQTASDVILGGNRHKILVMWVGVSNNGKSILSDLFQCSLGDYFYSPPTKLMTGKEPDSNVARADLAGLFGTRLMVISETGANDTMNTGLMKKLTGGDPIPFRHMYGLEQKMMPSTWKSIVHTNFAPKVDPKDKGMWNRIRMLYFESVFEKDASKVPETEKEQYAKKIFHQDNKLKDQLPQLAEVFIWWLIKKYEEYGDAPLYEPKEVIYATENYQKSNNYFLQFADEHLRKSDDPKAKLSKTALNTYFKNWFREVFPGMNLPNRNMVIDGLTPYIGPEKDGVWRGYVYYDPSEVDDDDAE